MIKGKKVTLRPATLDDRRVVFEWGHDSDIAGFIYPPGGETQTFEDFCADWKEYLAPPPAMLAVWSPDPPDPAAVDHGLLRKVLQRYQRVAQDPMYGMIAGLPEFRATQRALTAYLDYLADPHAGSDTDG